MTKKNRGNSPTELTKMKLIAASGGRCQFKGCNEKLFIESLTNEELNHSNIAHIVASSPNGPRGSDKSHELSNNLENLMLLCREHHKLVDDYPEKYPSELLISMKKEQEENVSRLLDGMYFPKSEIVILESKIKNKIDVKVNLNSAIEANRKDGYNHGGDYGINIFIESRADYKSEEYWINVKKDLIGNIEYSINNLYSRNPDIILSVFPLAPIPLVILFGFLLNDKKKIIIHQKYRNPDSWNWKENKLTNNFTIQNQTIKDGDNIAIILSLTAKVNVNRILDVFDASTIYTITAENIGVDSIASAQDLEEFWKTYLNLLDTIVNSKKVNEVALFPAIPVSAAFEIGHHYMHKVYPTINIYDECDGFFKTISIGG